MLGFRVSVGLSFVLITVNVAAQVISSPDEHSCNDKGTVTVILSDPTGGVIQNAFVLFRADQLGTPKAKTFLVELRTDSAGNATASVPCGYVDFFAAADGFKPHSEKMLIAKDISSVSVHLDVYPMIQTMIGAKSQ